MEKAFEKEMYYKNKLDCLFFYSKHINEIAKFLKNQEIATKIHIIQDNKDMMFIRRGSKDLPLFIKELNPKTLTKQFFELRTKTRRADAIEQKLLNKTQEKLWLYFPPNKPVEFYYATNSEGQGKPIERIFIDIDRTNLDKEIAKKVAKQLIDTIKKDKDFNKLLNYEIKVLFTGSSYHVYLMLDKPVTHDFYEKYIAYSKNEKIPSFISKWAKSITNKTKIQVTGGHEKTKDVIILDPSGTPSGKLARLPFSIHVKNNKIDAIAELVEL